MNNVYTSTSYDPRTGTTLEWYVLFNPFTETFEGEETSTAMKFDAPTIEEAQGQIKLLSQKAFNGKH